MSYRIALLLLLFPLILTSQIITTDPAFPTENNPVTIIFDATGTALENINGDVYAHTGVIINEEDMSGGNWRYVIAPWPSNPNDNIDKARLTNVGGEIWELHIEDIREFYNIPPSVEKVYQLALVFRNAAGSQQTSDLFVDLFDEVINVRFTSPQVSSGSPAIYSLGDELLVRAVANSPTSDIDSIVLFEDETRLFAAVDSDTLEFDYTIEDRGRKDFVVRAYAGDETAEEFLYIIVNPDLVDAPIPADIIDGINYNPSDPTEVTLSIFAPHKSFIYVIGDFNDWELSDAYFMNRDFQREDSVRYWITITGLEPGKEYGFQYLVDGEIPIADFYAEKVLDPWHDSEIISRGVYPGLMEYPHGKTDHYVSVLQTGQQPYQWEVESFDPPEVDDLVIYELLIRDFIGAHDYATLIDTLDYLQELGINAIELMPINQFEGNLSWGYNPAMFFAPDKFYGPRNDLKRFVDEAHKRGMAVILDMVWNHSFGLSPMLRMYFDADNNRPADENPWYHDQIFTNPGMRFGYKFNHGSKPFQEFMKRANIYWIEEYKIDGYRFDLTKGFTTRLKGNNDPWASLYDQERVDNLVRVANEIHEVNPKAYVILEHLADNSEETVLANNNMLLWGNLNFQYNEATMGYPSDLTWGVYRERNWNDPHLITYMESHDEERLMFRNLEFGNSANDYDVRNLPTALERVALASAFFYTIPGPKMLWQFGELGYDYSINHCPNGTINPSCRVDPKPIRWDYFQDEDRRRLYNMTSDLIYLKTNYDVFKTRDFDYRLNTVVKRVRLRGDDMQVVALGNFRVVDSQIRAEFYKPGKWYDYISGDSLMVEDTAMIVPLKAGEFRVYLDRRIDRPSGDFSTSVLPDIPDHQLPLELFPNPSSERVINIAGHIDGMSQLVVTDLQGRTIFQERYLQLDGQTRINLPADMSSGLYIISVFSDKGSATFKWVLE